MSTYTQIFYHIVFSTKARRPTLSADRREELLRYIWGIVNNLHCHLYRVNAVEDHVHIFSSLHPTVCLSDYIKTIKTSTTTWIKEQGVFRDFGCWQEGYGAFIKSYEDKGDVIAYIKNQQEHHKYESFHEELKRLLKEAGIEFDEKYLD